MLSADLVKKIRHIEIATRRLLNSTLVGDHRSSIKGSGFEFEQIREYQMGDDIRFIDWNSSARMNKMLVKEYSEERSRTIIVAVDGSASGIFSSSHTLRSDLMAQIASVVSLVANYGNDNVGLMIFSDSINHYIPPNKGYQHVRKIMETVFTYKADGARTNLNKALERLASLHLRDAMVFMVSDFIDDGFQKKLKYVAKKFDVIAVRCIDQHEQQLPDVGFLTIEDSETGQLCTIDTRKNNARNATFFLHDRLNQQKDIFNKAGIDSIDIYLNKPFIPELVRLFRYRMMY